MRVQDIPIMGSRFFRSNLSIPSGTGIKPAIKTLPASHPSENCLLPRQENYCTFRVLFTDVFPEIDRQLPFLAKMLERIGLV